MKEAAMRKMTKGMTGWITAVCIALCIVLASAESVVFAEPAYETAPGVDIQIRLIGFEDREYEIGTVVPAQLEAVLFVQDQQAGIASVFYSIEADGQGWNYQVPICSIGEYETSPDPSAGYDNVQQGMLEEWNILEAEGNAIHCMSRTIYVYAQYSAVIRLAFTDQMGNLYSYQENYLVEQPAWESQPLPEEPEVMPDDAQAASQQQDPAEESEMLGEPELLEQLSPEEVAEEPEIQPEQAEATPAPEGITEEPEFAAVPEVQPEQAEELPAREEAAEEPELTNADEVQPESEEVPPAPEEITEEAAEEQEVQPEQEEAAEEPEVQPEQAEVPPAPEEITEEAEHAAVQEMQPEQAEEPPARKEGAEEPELTNADEVQPESEEVQPVPEDVTEEQEPAETPQAQPEPEEPQEQTWSSYSGTPSYYYPQTAYSSGGARGASSYSASAGRSSYVPSAGSAPLTGKETAAGDGKESSTTDEKEGAESAAKTDRDAGKETGPDQNTKAEEDQEPEGSIYDLSAIEKYNGKYLKEVEDLVIYESNTRKVLPESVQVLVSRNKEMMELEKDTDYTFKLTGSSADQKIYKYTINKSVFIEDGAYRIYLFSEDEAGHYNTSESMDTAIWFYIDNVSPLILSVESTKEQETKGVREIRIKDDTQLSDIEIYLGDQKVEFEEDGETYRFPVSKDNEHADVKVVAKDRAGNSYERVLTNYVQAGKAKVRAGMSPLPIILLAAAAIMAGVFVYRRRKNPRRTRRTR